MHSRVYIEMCHVVLNGNHFVRTRPTPQRSLFVLRMPSYVVSELVTVIASVQNMAVPFVATYKHLARNLACNIFNAVPD